MSVMFGGRGVSTRDCNKELTPGGGETTRSLLDVCTYMRVSNDWKM